MKLKQLLRLVRAAKNEQPPKELLNYCGDYYSPYYNFMFLTAVELTTGYCVELGCEKGRGLLALAMSGRGVIGIESQPQPKIDEVLNAYSNIEFYVRSSLPVWESLFEGKQIGLLHIDTEHSYSQAKNEFEAYQPYLIDGAIVIFDDLHAMNDGVKKYFDELPYDKIQDDDLHPSCGWGVVLYNVH